MRIVGRLARNPKVRLIRLGLSLALLLPLGACTKDSKNDGKDYSLTPGGMPLRQPDMIAYLKAIPTDEETDAFLKEVRQKVDPPNQIMSISPPKKVFEIWFTPDANEDDKGKLRKFLKSSPLVERVEET